MINKTFHGAVYGPQGTGKSWLVGTFGRAYLEGKVNGPLLVLMFDPYGKDSTYFKPALYQVSPKEMELREGKLDLGVLGDIPLIIPCTEVWVKGVMATRVDYIHESHLVFDQDDYTKIKGWTGLPILRRRINRLFRDEQEQWGTIGYDSVTSSELMIRNYQKYEQNPGARGEAQKRWWGESTDEHERILCIQFGGWRRNFLIICHTDTDKVAGEGGGVLRYAPKLPGRLRADLSTYFSEFYHSFAVEEEGEILYGLQTRPSDLYTAFSQTCEAPNPCRNDYDALWRDR